MLLVYCPEISSRCVYAFEFIFKHELGIDYRITEDLDEFRNCKEEKINYSSSKIDTALFIKRSSLLFETEIKPQRIEAKEEHGTKVLFADEESDIGFDIFSAAFYMISRYEEYLPFTPDEHGRFRAKDSVAFQCDLLHIPVVNTWINIFKTCLEKSFPLLKTKTNSFKAIVTYDIDVAYKFRGRSLGRITGAAIKDLLNGRFKDIIQRKLTLLKIKKDPWDIYDSLQETILKNNLSSIFFFLLSDKTTYDRNLNYKNSLVKKLINKIASFSEIGIHPSYYSSVAPEKILIEKERLEKISGKKISKSRQHYLKFNLPHTYNALIAAGITEDYSMGFADAVGFRAGTCSPFYFYDLKNEKATALKIFPVTLMEGVLINSGRNRKEAIQQVSELIKETKKAGGTFISIWHNHTVSESKEYVEWKNVHDEMIGQLTKQLSG